MTRRHARKDAYRLIYQEDKTHQEAFDALEDISGIDAHTLAKEVSKIPSERKRHAYQGLIYTYVGILAIVMILRTSNTILVLNVPSIDISVLALLVAFAILLPIYGIYGALTSRNEAYSTMVILMGISASSSLREHRGEFDLPFFLMLLPFLLVIALAILLIIKLKTPYTVQLIESNKDGKLSRTEQFIFEDSKLADKNLLDSDFVDRERSINATHDNEL